LATARRCCDASIALARWLCRFFRLSPHSP
jgi:hypothetical protein